MSSHLVTYKVSVFYKARCGMSTGHESNGLMAQVESK